MQKDYLICVESTFFPGSNLFSSPGAGERERMGKGREGKKKEPVVKVEVVSHLFNNRICYASSLCTSDVLDVQLDDHILPRYDISQIFPSGWNPVLFPLRIMSSVLSCGI